MRTRWSVAAATSAGKPCASGPNNHAVGALRSAWSRSVSPSTVVASSCSPAARNAVTASPAPPTRRPPAPKRCFRRKHADTCRCTDRRCGRRGRRQRRPWRRRCGSGCRHCLARRSRRRRRSAVVSRPAHPRRRVAGMSHTATSPTGVTVSDNAFAARSVTRCTGHRRPSSNDACRSAADSVTNTSRTRPRAAAAPTRLGPSARKHLARRRPT